MKIVYRAPRVSSRSAISLRGPESDLEEPVRHQRAVHGPIPVAAHRVHVRAGGEQRPDDVQVPVSSGLMERGIAGFVARPDERGLRASSVSTAARSPFAAAAMMACVPDARANRRDSRAAQQIGHVVVTAVLRECQQRLLERIAAVRRIRTTVQEKLHDVAVAFRLPRSGWAACSCTRPSPEQAHVTTSRLTDSMSPSRAATNMAKTSSVVASVPSASASGDRSRAPRGG